MNRQRHNTPFRLFAYGTLKRGFVNHDVYCRGAVSLHGAFVRGRLYELPEGIPILEVPKEDILATGTNDPALDLALQENLSDRLFGRTERPFPVTSSGERWQDVHGELITFQDPFDRLPALDDLEEFQPDGPCLYRRVLLAVHSSGRDPVLAWAYVLGTAQEPLRPIEEGFWPS